MNTCNTCKHWLNPPPDRMTSPNRRDIGQCFAAIHWDNDDKHEEPYKAAKAEMLVMDMSGCFAALFTSEDHGCTSWEAKEE